MHKHVDCTIVSALKGSGPAWPGHDKKSVRELAFCRPCTGQRGKEPKGATGLSGRRRQARGPRWARVS
eukprot:8328694-Lingulodinium_polyedra.AAC.1